MGLLMTPFQSDEQFPTSEEEKQARILFTPVVNNNVWYVEGIQSADMLATIVHPIAYVDQYIVSNDLTTATIVVYDNATYNERIDVIEELVTQGWRLLPVVDEQEGFTEIRRQIPI